MQLKVRAEDSKTSDGAPTLIIHDFTLNMVVYTFAKCSGVAPTKGRIEVAQLDEAIANAKAFMGGYCPTPEQIAMTVLIALLEWCKEWGCAVTWAK